MKTWLWEDAGAIFMPTLQNRKTRQEKEEVDKVEWLQKQRD